MQMNTELDYDTESPAPEYRRELDLCQDLQSLQALISKYSVMSPDLEKVKMDTLEEYEEFKAGLVRERQGIFNGEEWCAKYASIVCPVYMVYADVIAERFGVPWGTAYLQMCRGIA